MIERIGDIVRTVREREICSLEDLAHRSGVSLSVLMALEGGRPGITTTQLDDVAGVLSLDPIALLNGREVPKPVPSVFLRHTPMQDFDDRDALVLDAALEQGRSLANLRSALGEPAFALQAGIFVQRAAAADRSEAPAQDGYRLARVVRQWLGNVAEPLGDMGRLLEEQFGIAVLVRSLASSRVTATGIRAAGCAAVVLSARDPHRARNPLLARVHLAHELCHVLFDPSPGGLHIVVEGADGKDITAEQRARAFAAELLLPQDGLTRLLEASHDKGAQSAARDLVTRARSMFGTPHEIAANHLCNLQLIDRGLREWLEAEKTTFAGQPPETTLPAPDDPSRLVAEEVARAHREGMLTDGEARSILQMDRLAPLPWDEVEL
ncbi:MAG: ImmA/IrrE family metallo-endopeptidase [Byssovorax sp.]